MTAWNTKKVESTNLRSHGICVVVHEPRDTDDLGKRFPGTVRKLGISIIDSNRNSMLDNPQCIVLDTE